jgi:hypothetical protein
LGTNTAIGSSAESLVPTFPFRLRDNEADPPYAFAGVLDQGHGFERAARLRQHRLEQLAEAAIQVADQRDAVEQGLAEAEYGTADEVGGQESQERQDDDREQQADAGKRERQVLIWVVDARDQRFHTLVHPVDEKPGQVERDADGGGNHDAGEKVVAEPDARPPATLRRRLGVHDLFQIHNGLPPAAQDGHPLSGEAGPVQHPKDAGGPQA